MRSSLLIALALVVAGGSPALGGDLCLGPSAENGLNTTVLCDANSTEIANAYLGYSTDSTPCGWEFSPCEIGMEWDVGWMISASISNPNVNVGDFGSGPTDLYLWASCLGWHGMESAEFDLVGSLEVLGFQAYNGFVNSGPPETPSQLRLSVGGCAVGPVLVGAITVQNPIAVGLQEPVQSSTWGRVKAEYE